MAGGTTGAVSYGIGYRELRPASRYHWPPCSKSTVGFITTGIVGAVYAVAYLRNGHNLWALMLAHACTDSYGIAMLYFGRYA